MNLKPSNLKNSSRMHSKITTILISKGSRKIYIIWWSKSKVSKHCYPILSK